MLSTVQQQQQELVYRMFEVAAGFALHAGVVDGKGQFRALNVKTKCDILGNGRQEDRLEE